MKALAKFYFKHEIIFSGLMTFAGFGLAFWGALN